MFDLYGLIFNVTSTSAVGYVKAEAAIDKFTTPIFGAIKGVGTLVMILIGYFIYKKFIK